MAGNANRGPEGPIFGTGLPDEPEGMATPEGRQRIRLAMDERDANLIRCAHALAMLVDAFDLPTGSAEHGPGYRRRQIGRCLEQAREALHERERCAVALAAALGEGSAEA